jgi:hypothetical protein
MNEEASVKKVQGLERLRRRAEIAQEHGLNEAQARTLPCGPYPPDRRRASVQTSAAERARR